jgi:hypothetical protein
MCQAVQAYKVLSTDGVIERASGQRRHALLSVAVIDGGLPRGKKCPQEVSHQFHRAAQQHMVLPRALAHTHQQMIVFLHQRDDQRTVVRRQAGDQGGEGGVGRLAALLRGGAAATLPSLARVLDRGGLRLNLADGLENLVGAERALTCSCWRSSRRASRRTPATRRAARRSVVRGCQWGRSFMVRGRGLQRRGRRSGVAAGVFGSALGKTWWANWTCKLFANPNEPERLMLSASWLLIMSS